MKEGKGLEVVRVRTLEVKKEGFSVTVLKFVNVGRSSKLLTVGGKVVGLDGRCITSSRLFR